MENKILKIFWFSAFMCSNAFASSYYVRIENHLQEQIEISRDIADERKSRKIEAVDFSSKKPPHCLKKEILNAGGVLDLGIDALPRYESGKFDPIDLKVNNEMVSCVFNKKEGNFFVYPDLLSAGKTLTTSRGIQKYTFSDGCTCVLTQDRSGPDFTITISGTPNNSMVGSNSSSSSQGHQ